MVSVKRVLSVILVLTISILIGCSKVKDDNEVSLDLFDVFKGKELATNYLINIRNDDYLLIEGKDYNVTYADNVDVGEAIAIITGIYDYTGEVTKVFNILS